MLDGRGISCYGDPIGDHPCVQVLAGVVLHPDGNFFIPLKRQVALP